MSHEPAACGAPAGALTAPALLRAWEQAQAEHPLRRPLSLLRAAWPEVDAQAWGRLPLGARDGHLFALFEALFGNTLDSLVDCPACGEALELALSSAALRPGPQDALGDGAQAALTLHCDGYQLDYRLPAGDDLAAVMDAGDAAAAVQHLLAGCVLRADLAGDAKQGDALPPPVIERLQQAMAERDPGADIRVALSCPACGHGFERRFDIASHLWEELDDWAERTLAEVHLLARAYGWSEAEVLSLSAARRRHYIGLVQA
jgi:hypothetical protein